VAVRIKDWSSWLKHPVVTNATSMSVDVHSKEGGNNSSEMLVITKKLHGIVIQRSVSPYNPD